MSELRTDVVDHHVNGLQVNQDGKSLVRKLIGKGEWKGIIAVTRGGLVPAAIIARDQERRRGPVRVQLERQIRKPAAPEPEFKPRRLTTAERMDRAWRKRRYLTVAP